MEQRDFSSNLAKTAIEIITPVLENALMLSGKYATACGRDVILAKDLEYCMKYCAMNTVGQRIGSHFPEVYSDEEIEIDDAEEDDGDFKQYTGSDGDMRAITEAYESWKYWKPTNPSEQLLKNAIDSNEHLA